MSSQKTEHYQLHKWEPGDVFLRGEFNENFAAIDGALSGHDGTLAGHGETLEAQAAAIARKADGAAMTAALAGKADLAAMTAALAKKGEIVLFQYTGDGEQSRTFSLGFRPAAVLATVEGFINTAFLLVDGLTFSHGHMTDDGFYVTRYSSIVPNESGSKHTCLVLKNFG